MPFFDNDGVKIHYEIEGEGPDLVVIHGFAANIDFNWRVPQIIADLKSENRLILMDCRGHGQSDKPRSKDQYGAKMVQDITGRPLGIDDLMSYLEKKFGEIYSL